MLLRTVLWLTVAPAAVVGAQIEDFALGQAVQSGRSSVSAYVDAWDSGRGEVEALPVDAISATLGGEAMSVTSAVPFRESGEGVAYIFAVDISRSMSAEQFGRIRGALEAWFDRLGPLDRVALLSFGDASRVVVDFTDDRQALRDAIASLGPTDGTRVPFQALHDAIDLSLRRDPGLPRRRALVVLSDGLDEASGMTAEDVLVQLREQRLPVYSIGFGGRARRESLDLMLRFSTNSGGRYLEVEGSNFPAAYEGLRRAIERVWVVAMDCAMCRADGATYRLQMNLELADRVLSKGVDVRLLPPVGGAPPTERVAVEDAIQPPTAEAGFDLKWIGAGALAVALLGAAFLVGSRRRSSGVEAAPVKKKTRTRMSRRERKRNEVPIGAEPMAAAISARLVVVRGTEPGREYRFLLRNQGLVGT
ncbi:MAG: VWA domain-containing protein, partial [Acidobacteriota bacterium]|nr:VWA domain-containing protein [Acidobacteriota bacterium]